MFKVFVVIAIPKEMPGKHFLKVSSKSDIAIMSKLQIETLKFVHSSCYFTILKLVLSDHLNLGTNIFPTNLFQPTKFRTNVLPNHFKFGKITKLSILIGVQCFTGQGHYLGLAWPIGYQETGSSSSSAEIKNFED